MAQDTRCYTAAGITFELNSQFVIGEKTLHPKFNHFLSISPAKNTVKIHHCFSDIPPQKDLVGKNCKIVFKNDFWEIIVSELGYFYKYTAKYLDRVVYTVAAKFNRSHHVGVSYFDGVNQDQYSCLQLQSLVGLGSDQILFSRLLNHDNGFLFHANGVAISGKTLLFSGHSGVGKTTISNLLKKNGGLIFCDDRVIIQKKQEQYFASGSWIHQGASLDYNYSNKVDAVFFLEQASVNIVEPIIDIKKKYYLAIKSLIKDFHGIKMWNSTMTSVYEFVTSVPFYNLKFYPSNRVYEELCNKIIL